MDFGWRGLSNWDSTPTGGRSVHWDGVERRDVVSRRRRNEHRFMDRRGGFDRRCHYPVLGHLLERPALLVAALVLLNVLSLVDGFYSAVEVSLGIAHEGNPILAYAADQHWLAALGLKIGAMAFVTAIIWINRRRRAVLITGMIGLAGYVALVTYHRYVLSMTGLL